MEELVDPAFDTFPLTEVRESEAAAVSSSGFSGVSSRGKGSGAGT